MFVQYLNFDSNSIHLFVPLLLANDQERLLVHMVFVLMWIINVWDHIVHPMIIREINHSRYLMDIYIQEDYLMMDKFQLNVLIPNQQFHHHRIHKYEYLVKMNRYLMHGE